MAGLSDTAARARTNRDAFPPNWPARIGLIALAIYVVFASQIIDITWTRFSQGLGHAGHFLSRMFPPDFSPDKMQLLYSGMIESLQIAILATAFGISLSLPLGFAAARNISPAPLAWFTRGLIALLRSFHPVIVAILFVKAVGFGALAGILALIVASMGFISKLIAEAIEDMSMKPVEAVRATGASFFSVMAMAVVPQIMPRFIGFSSYQLDSNLRNSALVGLVGGGGIGATLFTAFQRFDYDFVLTIVLTVIAVVMVGEMLSGRVRRLFQ
jgi:phosphonate ABC transporter permease subunit PhnE